MSVIHGNAAIKWTILLLSVLVDRNLAFCTWRHQQSLCNDVSLVSRNQRYGGWKEAKQLTSSSANNEESTASTTGSITTTAPAQPTVPVTFDEMVKQAAKAMKEAYKAGVTRQIVRVLLPRDPSSGQLGRYFENDAKVDTMNLVLVPPDETWQGGIMQLYRAAAPTCQEILRRFSTGTGGVPPKMMEDRSVDESGVDGVGLWMTQNRDSADDVSCFVQPTQETIDAIESISKQAGDDKLVLLLNPQWRNVDDALDSASRNAGLFGFLASVLGGKGESLKRLDEMHFRPVFSIEGYVCKGGNIRLVQTWNSDWIIYAENDGGTEYILVGTATGSRPTYQDIDKMLDAKGITLKYARDIGLAPKF